MYHLLEFTDKGIYCPQANVYIDPWKPVNYAIVTHAHSDHAHYGCARYLAHKHSEPIMRMRLGENISLQTVEYNEPIHINGVKFTLHPAGHIIGSAQIRVEFNGHVWVAAGDYKLQDDNFCEPFEVVKCNVYITESTFGLPIYKWQPQQNIMNDIASWVAGNKETGKTSVLMGYALGKMQRIIANLPMQDEIVYAHGAVYNVNERLRQAGFNLPYVHPITKEVTKEMLKGALVLAPTSADHSAWLKRFPGHATGYCSGWMAVRGAKTRRALDKGFILSDHGDWEELNTAVKATGAETVFVTHGSTAIFAKWLTEQGIDAREIKTMYGTEEQEEIAEAANTNNAA